MDSEIERLRLERDMLVLNRNVKDPSVFVVTGDDGNVAGVTWLEGQAGSANSTFFPKWWTERCTTRSN